jgi:hypothetical protein
MVSGYNNVPLHRNAASRQVANVAARRSSSLTLHMMIDRENQNTLGKPRPRPRGRERKKIRFYFKTLLQLRGAGILWSHVIFLKFFHPMACACVASPCVALQPFELLLARWGRMGRRCGSGWTGGGRGCGSHIWMGRRRRRRRRRRRMGTFEG